MKDIIPKIDRAALKAELSAERFLRHTTKAGNQLYLVNCHNAPQTLREIGRLRELTFRTAGGGTGKDCDLDDHDLHPETPYDQLIVWDPEDQEITAGYRILDFSNYPLDRPEGISSATAHLFDFSERFTRDYLPKTLELGRSFVQPQYQRGAPRKGLFALDNLWDGLAALMMLNPNLRYFLGKVTMYPDFNPEARNITLAFLQHFFPDDEELVRPKTSLISKEELLPFARPFAGMDYKAAHRLLSQELKQRGESIPPLINSYMNISPSMRTFGTAVNAGFGGVEETGILLTYPDIYPERKNRYEETFSSSRVYTGP